MNRQKIDAHGRNLRCRSPNRFFDIEKLQVEKDAHLSLKHPFNHLRPGGGIEFQPYFHEGNLPLQPVQQTLGLGDCYTFKAIDPVSKLMPCWLVGFRTTEALSTSWPIWPRA